MCPSHASPSHITHPSQQKLIGYRGCLASGSSWDLDFSPGTAFFPAREETHTTSLSASRLLSYSKAFQLLLISMEEFRMTIRQPHAVMCCSEVPWFCSEESYEHGKNSLLQNSCSGPVVEPCCPHLCYPGATPVLGLANWTVQDHTLRQGW